MVSLVISENHDDSQFFDIEAFQDHPPFPFLISDDTPELKQIRRKNGKINIIIGQFWLNQTPLVSWSFIDRQLFEVPEDLEPTHNLDDNDNNEVNSVMKTR